MYIHTCFVLVILPFIVQVSAAATCNTTKSTCMCQNGRDGRDGRDGMSIQGPSGRDGVHGQEGRDCVECAKGPKGDKGDQGPQGKIGTGGSGPAGKKGDKGASGGKGDLGPAGEKGAKGDAGVCDQAALSKLQSTMAKLEKEIRDVKAESASSKSIVSRVNVEVIKLRLELTQLKKEAVTVGSNKKIKQSLLPGGYSDFSVIDLQWQSLHMSAAAACRAITASGGSGPNPNRVYPRTINRSCNDVCKHTPYKECDAELSLLGNMNVAKTSQDEVGMYYNYGCDDKRTNPMPGYEPKVSSDQILKAGTYMSYCCCR